MLNLWWGITEHTYLYYWHHKVWSVLGCWVVLALLLILMILLSEELWRAGYKEALRSVAALGEPPSSPTSAHNGENADKPNAPEKRSFLAPPSKAFPGVRSFFSRGRHI
jgi:hypothetical protein